MAEDINRFKILEKIIRISNSTVDVERRLQNIVQVFEREMGFDRAYLFSMDPDARVLTLKNFNRDSQPDPIRVELTESFISQAAIKRLPLTAGPQEVENLPANVRDLLANYGLIAAYPITDDQILYGVLTLLYQEKKELSPKIKPLIEAITREMAGTIRNSRLYAESKKRITELSVLYEVGRAMGSTINLDKILDTVVNITCKVLMAEGCSLNVFDTSQGGLRISAEYGVIPSGCSFKHLLATPGRTGPTTPDILTCVGRREPYMGPAGGDKFCQSVRELDTDKSIICLPLTFKGHFKGTLSLFNKLTIPPGPPSQFHRDDLELLTTMGTMISSALENAMTFQSVDSLARRNERLVRNLSCLYEISGAMMTTVKLDELLSIITNALTMEQGLGFDRALIFLMAEEEDALLGAAIREINPGNKNDADRSLADSLRQGPPDLAFRSDRERDFLAMRLPLYDCSGVIVRTARENRAFILGPNRRSMKLENNLPTSFGHETFATMPMLAKGKVVGVIAVDRDFSRQDITDEDMRNLSMLANQAGLAIENSRLYEYIEGANQTLSQTRERLIEAEKLAALGEMAAGMAHEIRNPLVSIGGFTRRLLKTMGDDSPHKVYIEVIINEVTRLEKTLSEVLDFSSIKLGDLERHDLNDVIHEALYTLKREFKEGQIQIVKELSQLPPVLIDERQIKHVFLNLFFNAHQAMSQGGTLTVKTFVTVINDRPYVSSEISDTGPGIDPEVLPNIFNPFFTTKVTGTGLGLSIVHKILSRHHGEIDVVNRVDQGATFVVKLPAASQSGLYLK